MWTTTSNVHRHVLKHHKSTRNTVSLRPKVTHRFCIHWFWTFDTSNPQHQGHIAMPSIVVAAQLIAANKESRQKVMHQCKIGMYVLNRCIDNCCSLKCKPVFQEEWARRCAIRNLYTARRVIGFDICLRLWRVRESMYMPIVPSWISSSSLSSLTSFLPYS